MNFTLASKAAVTDDAAPTAGAPATSNARVVRLPEYLDTGRQVPTAGCLLRTAVLNGGGARVSGGTVDVDLWVWDATGSLWVHVDAKTALGNDQEYEFPTPATGDFVYVYPQIKNVTGAAAASVEIGIAPTGQLQPDVNVGAVNVTIAASAGLATSAKQDTGNTSLGHIDTATAASKTDLDTIASQTAGLATAAAQTTGNTSLSGIKTDADTLVTNTTGLATQATAAAEKTDLDTIVTNTTGVATAANQATANASLSTIATNTTGVATAANQSTANTTLSSIKTDDDSIATNTSNTATNTSGSKTDLDAIKTDDDAINTATAGAKTDLDKIVAVASFPTVAPITCSNSAAVLPTQAVTHGFRLTSDPANTVLIYVGPSSVTSAGANAQDVLMPGQSKWFGGTNVNAYYQVAASGSPRLFVHPE